MECPKCGSKLKVIWVRHYSSRLTRRLKRCTKKTCKWQILTRETY
jgi:hypothetical protein